jgi:anti-anti-sigma regulatory factor
MASDIHQSYRIEHEDKIAIVTPLEMDDMLGHMVHEASGAVIDDLKKQPPVGLILDLSRVKLFRSNFLAFLLRLHTMSKRLKADMCLAETQPAGLELLKLTSLDKLWTNYPTRADAIKAMTAKK